MKRDLKRFGCRRIGWLAGAFCSIGAFCAPAWGQETGQHADLQAMQIELPQHQVRSISELPPVEEPGEFVQGEFAQVQYQAWQADDGTNVEVTSMSRRLQVLNWEQFEQKLVELWGDQLQAVAEDEQGSRIRIFIPGPEPGTNQIVIDRYNNAVTFEGGAIAGRNWTAMMDLLDSRDEQNDGSIRLVGMRQGTTATVRRAVALLGVAEDHSATLNEALQFVPFRDTARIAAVPQRRTPLNAIPYRPRSGSATGQARNSAPANVAANVAAGSASQPNRTVPARPAGVSQTPATTPPPVSTASVRTRPAAAVNTPRPASGPSTIVAEPIPSGPQPQEQPQPVQQGQDQRIIEIDDATLEGNVKIKVLEDMGTIVLIGAPEDVAKVRAIIDQIVSSADDAQPSVELYELANADSTRVKDIVDEVYSSMYELNSGTVSVTALTSPNALLVIAQPPAQSVIMDLIKKLDSVSPETVEAMDFQVFRPKYMSAIDAALRLQGYFRQSDQDSDTVDSQEWIAAIEGPVSIIQDYRSNSVIVKGNARVLRAAARLINELDVVDNTGAKHVVRFFPVENTSASELAIVLQAAINGQLQGAPTAFTNGDQFGGGQQNQLQGGGTNFGAAGTPSRLPTAQLEFTTIDGESRTARSGVLFDVKVTADNNSNQVMVSGPVESMDLVAALVRQLDRLPNAETLIKVFTIINGDATQLLATLQSIFGQNQAAGGQGGGFNQQNAANLQFPLQTASQTPGAALINLRFAVEQRTNSIIVSGPEGDLIVVEDLLNRLDEEDLQSRVNSIYRLRNAPAEDVATAINEWLTSRQEVFDADPTSSSAFESARRQVVVVPELVGNSLIISATPAYYDELIRLIQDLDRRPPMVKIKVLIAEVNLNKLSEFGIEVGIQDSLLFDRGLGVVGFPFNQDTIGNNSDALSLATRELLAGQALSNLNIGRVNSDVGYGGLVLSAGNESISVLMRALENRNVVRVLSTPDIMTVDNLRGTIQVGASVPRITDATQNNIAGGVNISVEDVSVGVILEVTPRVSPDGMIVMNVDAINSNLGSEEAGIPVFVSDGQVIRSPQINITEAQTTIMARSGQTVAFSGLIQDTVSDTRRGTPILSDLPVIGPLFTFEQEAHTRTELLIVLTPYLIDSDDQIVASNRAAMDRMNWCLEDVAEVYGPIGYNGEFDESLSGMVPATYYPDQDPTGENPQYLPLEPRQDGPPNPAPQGSIPAEMFEQPAVIPQARNPEVPYRPAGSAPGRQQAPAATPNGLPPQGQSSHLQQRQPTTRQVSLWQADESKRRTAAGNARPATSPLASARNAGGTPPVNLPKRLTPARDSNTAGVPQITYQGEAGVQKEKISESAHRIRNPFYR